ncbi:hypothetical protein V0U79_11030 [Hyphobacterium sp. HN65]|uniref:Uncharacterized protein n=1 Tax=Hyphobacterium lacteum TaxID=3116575 RepID=A0ABU7LSR1_9PROT|nr:hypothetical protein [Hyphobacterium sp. HN65]MEE2526905.1 hypothetical protein [Hyphobacterium sp. HN65]
MNTSSQSDLDYLRSVAESGAQAPLVGGRYLIIWGGLGVIACLAHWSILTGVLPLEASALGAIWIGYGVLGMIATFLASRSMAAKPGCGSIGNRVNRVAWQYVGIGIGLYFAGVIFSVTALDAPPLLFDSILTIALFGYAIAFSVTAALSSEKWLYGPAWMSIAGAALSPAFYGRPELYLLVGAIILFAAVLPGFRLLGKEPGASDE